MADTVNPNVDVPFDINTPDPAGFNRNKNISLDSNGDIFPSPDDRARLDLYSYYELLFFGQHFEAFKMKIADPQWGKEYGKLRYVKANFAGLISKVVADMLFSEPLTIRVPGGDQTFVDALVYENQLDIQFYESALSNSYMGDALFKVRAGPKHSGTDEDSTIIIEDTNPSIYFPHINRFNVREDPYQKDLSWVFEKDGKKYLRTERHTPGKIENFVNLMEDTKIGASADLSILGINNIKPVEETGITRSLLVHVPNWKVGKRYFGISDYFDLDNLFYAINNRLTKTDNILDKHSDPILAVPEGILDEKGKVKRQNLSMVQVPEGTPVSEGKPEYVVWNASLENAFKQIEKMVEFLFMTSETSPDVLGMGQGMSDSGRALKYKLLRTIAKVARKKLYYNYAIKEAIYVAQLLAQKHGFKVNGVALTKTPVIPELKWADGLPIDESEQVETENKRIEGGTTTAKDAIMRIDGVDEDTAEEKVKEINEEKKLNIPMPNFGTTNPFSKNKDANMANANMNGDSPDDSNNTPNK